MMSLKLYVTGNKFRFLVQVPSLYAIRVFLENGASSGNEDGDMRDPLHGGTRNRDNLTPQCKP